MFVDALPQNYRSYPTLILCSNNFINVKIPIGINRQPLVLIGQGTIPLVWLAAPSNPNASTWIYVVKESKAANPGIDVKWSARDKTLKVEVGGADVIRILIENDSRANATFLNLRPLGLDVTGTEKGLIVGGNTFSGNTVQGSELGINLSVPNAQVVET